MSWFFDFTLTRRHYIQAFIGPAPRSVNQTSNLGLNNHVEFQTADPANNGITVSAGGGQLDGLFTIAKDGDYLLECSLGSTFSASSGRVLFQWRNNTTATLVGGFGQNRPLTFALNDNYIVGPAVAMESLSAGDQLEVRIITVTASLTSIIALGSYARILEL